ncbi:low molecular weight protein-tyrosine-phosphatase [Hoyosella altamirensis]|nr:low molecular weight protein-tyrosine-phosphatase [Hoyosella altamirensis]
MHITFVCTGNICRSPMAERIVADVIEREGLADHVRVSSAGTGGWHVGDPADHRTVATLRRHGYSTTHRAEQVNGDHLSADLIVALDRGHAKELRKRGADPDRLRLLRSFEPDAEGEDVADPYYGDMSDFEEVRQQIEAALPGLVAWIRENM